MARLNSAAPLPPENLKISFNTVEQAEAMLADYDFQILGEVLEFICAHPRVSKTLAARAAAIRQKAKFVVKYNGKKLDDEAPAAQTIAAAVRKALSLKTLADIITNFRLMDCCFVEVAQLPELPRLRVWPARSFYKSNNTWFRRTRRNQEQEDEAITLPGNHLLLGTESDPTPWFSLSAGWKPLSNLTITHRAAWGWWTNCAMHQSLSTVFIETQGVDEKVVAQFFKLLEKIGQTPYMQMPYGMTAKRLEAASNDYKGVESLVQEANKQVTELLEGQSTSTRMDTAGSYGAIVALLQEVSLPMMAYELQLVSESLSESWLPLVLAYCNLPGDYSIAWEIEDLGQEKLLAEIKKLLAEVEKLKGGGYQ